mgnify:FL=1
MLFDAATIHGFVVIPKNLLITPVRHRYYGGTSCEGKTGSTYTVLVPWDAAHNTISLEVGGKTMTAKLSRITYDTGKSYTYRLTVGKEKLETTEVTVSDWTGSAVIPGGEAKAN